MTPPTSQAPGWRLRTALLLGGVLVVASCGGLSVSLGEYVERANAICADATLRMDEVIDPCSRRT